MDTSVNFYNSSAIPPTIDCPKYRTAAFIFIAWFIVYILLFPLFISVLYIGYQRWRKKYSDSTAVTHSDVLIFHTVAVEMLNLVGLCLYYQDLFTGTTILGTVGTGMIITGSYEQMFFHALICVERYVAVIHPITYRGLKRVGTVRIRNLSIGCVWLFSCGLSITINTVGIYDQRSLILQFSCLILCAAFTIFCIFSVLSVLIRPGPGEVGRDKRLINKAKRRAFNTMTTIMGALLMKFINYTILSIVVFLVKVADVVCAMIMCSLWFNVPSTLVLPLLFLHRGKRQSGKQKEVKMESI